jgi:hypothetical protein
VGDKNSTASSAVMQLLIDLASFPENTPNPLDRVSSKQPEEMID